MGYRLVLALGSCLAASPWSAAAQEAVDATFRGTILLADSALTSGTVVLHALTPDSQGEVDSVAVDTDGMFSFRLPQLPLPDGTVMYFASIRHDGILYFGAALTLPAQLDSVYRIQTWDTASASTRPEALVIEVRNIFLEAEREGESMRWKVTDLFQMRNDARSTLIAGGAGTVWTHPLPEAAEDARFIQGDVGEEAVRVTAGLMEITAPLSPGAHFAVFEYFLPDLFFAIPTLPTTELVDVLVGEPAPPLVVPGLEAQPAQELGETTFRRFSASTVPSFIQIEEVEPPRPPPVKWMAVFLALALTGIGLSAVLRRPGRAARPGRPAPDEAGRPSDPRTEALLQVAHLDDEFEGRSDATDTEREQYQARRAELLARLRRRG